MKKTVIILSVFFLSFSCYAQKFINPTKEWIVEWRGDGMDGLSAISSVYYKFFGDTIVGNETYAKLYSSTKMDQSDWELYFLCREDETGKVFQIISDDYERPIYDFNLTVGDTMKNDHKEMDAIVDSVVVKPFGSVNKKYLYLHLIFLPSHILTWVEGVGSLFDPMIPDDFWVTGGTSKLICFEENGVLVYHNPDYPSCFFTSSQSFKDNQNLIDLFSPQYGEIQIHLKTNTQGNLFLYTLDGKQVLNKELSLSTTTICAPTCGILLYRFIGKGGEVQNGKVMVK